MVAIVIVLFTDIDEATDQVTKKTQDLRQHLRKAVADHVSDVFVDPNGPLETLCQSALNGDAARVEKNAETFAHHAEKIIQVSCLSLFLVVQSPN